MNKIIIIGNLTGDPAIRTTRDGISVCDFTVAVNGHRKEDPAQFFRVSAWRQMGENCHKYLAKGRKVCVTGAVSAHTYQGNDGTTRVSQDIQANEVEFLSTASGDSQQQAQRAPEPQQPVYTPITPDDDLPF